MSDYTQNTTFATKDALSAGDPEKIILGADFDAEFVEIATASATKEDASGKGAASGYASLTSSTLLLAAEIPWSTQLEAETLTNEVTVMNPHTLNDVLIDNGGILKDLQQLAAPGADALLAYDFGTTSAKGFTLGAGLAFSGDTINLADAVAGAGLSIASSVISLDINELAADTPVMADTIAFEDTGGGADNKCTITVLMTLLENNITLQEADISDLGAYYSSGDSPTFATITTTGGIELGHATDTTLTRSEAGQMLIQGLGVFAHDATYASAQVTYSTGAATGGTSGDLHITHAA